MEYRFLIFITFFALSYTLPVTKQKVEEKTPEPAAETPNEEEVLEYERYLREVVQALESDPEFKKKLDKAPEADIRNGQIARELEFVGHHVRNKLSEIKRKEIERLRQLANKQYELSNHIDREHLKIPQHLNHENEHTFEIEDLRKLILKASADLAEADKKRREEFKTYEMQKEFEKQQKLKAMDEQHRKEYEKELEERKKKHSQHEKVHHPGSKAQLEEVWEKQDEMDGNDFDPKVFFKMHDLDDNGYWDETEVKALFVKELDKVYQEGVPEDDMRERAEEMENMREHVFRETDTNRDSLISFEEFLNQTKTKEFNSDPGWETIDNSTPFSQNEYHQFELQREAEIKRLIEEGKLPPQPIMPDGYYNYDVHHQQVPPMQMPNQYPPMNNQIHRDPIQQQQQQHYQQQQQYVQGNYQQQQPMMPPQYQAIPQGNSAYQQSQQIPQYLPQQVPVEHVPHQQMHVGQVQQPQGQQPKQQQPYIPQQVQMPQQTNMVDSQQAAQQQQQVPQQQIPQHTQQQAPQQQIPQNPHQQVPQPQIQQQRQQQPIAPAAPGQKDIPQIKINHV